MVKDDSNPFVTFYAAKIQLLCPIISHRLANSCVAGPQMQLIYSKLVWQQKYHISQTQSTYFKIDMLSHYYNRKSSLEVPKKDVHAEKEDDIVNSFYEERRSRSFNTKQHNLLKKNISYFHQGSGQKDDQPDSSSQQPSSYDNSPINRTLPLNFPPKLGNDMSKAYSKPFTPQSTAPPVSDKQEKHQESSAFSSVGLTIQKPIDEAYKQHLKNQLNKRINIKHYLTEISQQNKENDTSISNDFKMNQVEYSREKSFGHSFERLKSLNADNSIVPAELSRISHGNSRDSRNINQSRHSIGSLLLEAQNGFQFSKNEKTDRIKTINRPTFGSEKTESRHRQSINSQCESGMKSNKSKQQQRFEQQEEAQKINVLSGEELASLNQNSHPLRQTSENIPKLVELKRRYDYFDPEEEANYKRHIGDLQREVAELKAEKRREEKFIQSIFKMRRVMLETDEDCNLKQLWRWIKQLPTSHPKK